MTKYSGDTDDEKKHYNIFLRRAINGECFCRPYLGLREFSCNFELIEENKSFKPRPINENKDLGWMLYDIDFVKSGDSYKQVKNIIQYFLEMNLLMVK